MQLRNLSMKSLRVNVVSSLALLGILSAATTANAQCPLLLSVKLTAYQQDLVDEEVSPTLIQSTFKQIKITTLDVLDLLAEHYDMTFPTGSKICFHRDSGDTTMNVYDKSGNLLLKVDEAVMDILSRPEPSFDLYTVPDEWVVKCDELEDPPDGCVDIPLQIFRHTNSHLLALSRVRTNDFVAGQYWTIGILRLTSTPAIDVVLGGQMISKFTWTLPATVLKTTETIDVMARGELDGEPAIFAGRIRFLGQIPLIQPPPEED